MSVITRNCPSCGGVVGPEATRCQYCSSLLQTVSCTSCFGTMFLGTRFCPHCGKRTQAAESADKKARHPCPRCKETLTPLTLVDTKLEECQKCGGLWIDSARFEQICGDSEAQTAAIGLNIPPPPPRKTEAAFYVPCPQCKTMMNRMNYAHCSGIIIDICKPHGIWFDRDELRKIIEFIRAGGLDKSRERRRDELKRQERQVESARMDTYTTRMPDNDIDVGGTIDSADLLAGLARAIWSILR